MNILIMGPAGAGKGTMSDLILKEYNIAHISTGDMLRENVRNSTALGLEAQSYMNQGSVSLPSYSSPQYIRFYENVNARYLKLDLAPGGYGVVLTEFDMYQNN